jgi:hypothetical protein
MEIDLPELSLAGKRHSVLLHNPAALYSFEEVSDGQRIFESQRHKPARKRILRAPGALTSTVLWRSSTSEVEPVRRLMIAVLVDAVLCLQTKSEARRPAPRQEFAEARTWMFSNDESKPFSFRAVCEALEVDPEAIRKGLARWKEEQLSRGKPRMLRRPMRQSSAFRQSGTVPVSNAVDDALKQPRATAAN